MTQKETENSAVKQQESLPSLSLEACAKTAGERIHNEITYRGVDWVANTAFAVGFAYWANRTPMGRKIWSENVQSGFKHILRPLIKEEKTLQRSAELGTDFTSIMVGGTVIIPPMIVLDKYKRPVVEWMDRKIYGDQEVDENERFAIRYDAIENAPKKGFWTGMGARVLVLTPMLTAHMNETTNPMMKKWMYEPIGRVGQAVAKSVGWQPQGLMKEVLVNQAGEFETHWNYLRNTFGMDVSLTFIYSFAHEWAYKGLTNLFHGHKPEASPQPQIEAKSSEVQATINPSDKVALTHT